MRTPCSRVLCGPVVDKAADYNTTLVAWSPTRDQAFKEHLCSASPSDDVGLRRGKPHWPMRRRFSRVTGRRRAVSANIRGNRPRTRAGERRKSKKQHRGKIVSTDPHATTTSDTRTSRTSYVWLRRPLCSTFPELFSTVCRAQNRGTVATRIATEVGIRLRRSSSAG